MTFDAISRELDKKIYHPIYFLYGAEPYFIDMVSNHIEHKILQEHEKDFNLTVLYGKDSSASNVAESARRTPMMSEYQVVMVKEAQAMRDLDQLLTYVENPSKSTVLCIVYRKEKFDKRVKFFKELVKHAAVMESNPIKESQIPSWVKSYLEKDGYGITDEAAHMVSEYLGNALDRVSNELNKVKLQIGEPRTIELEDIQNNIGINKDYNVFELGSAFGRRDKEKVFKILYFFALNNKNHPIFPVLGYLYTYFSKTLLMHSASTLSDGEAARVIGAPPFVVKEYRSAMKNYTIQQLDGVFDALKEMDLKAKGVNSSNSLTDRDLYTEFAYKVLS